jgi:nucleoside-diphosphate-sugar epimerase
MNILVTGGTGFIGSHLIEDLLAQGHAVTVIVRNRTKLARFSFHDRVEVIDGDILALAPLPDRFDYVIHLASLTKVITRKQFDRNRQGMLSLLQALSSCNRLQKIVLLSSISAAGPSPCNGVIDETMASHPISWYGKSKLEEERVLQATAPRPWLIVRAPIVFGEGDLDMLALFRIVKRGILPRLGAKKRLFSIIYAGDLVAGILHATFAPLTNTLFYISHPEPIEWQELMRAAAHAQGRKRLLPITVPAVIARGVGLLGSALNYIGGQGKIINRDKVAEMLQPCWLCSNEKCTRLLGFTPQADVQQKLAQTVAWYKQNGLL